MIGSYIMQNRVKRSRMFVDYMACLAIDDILKRLLPRGIYRNAADHRIETLNLEVKQIRSEMGALSPTAQFAAYFRKERVLNQLSAELSALSKSLPDEAYFFLS
ncbi:hypothetical protein WUBG_07804 [Wuchereria bancrofti]|uniref:Uncharacterized protein n=1 Tax=Wuchereria bancrofti TaxID=6293 RepID=J9F1Q9_WUCBA|nr:hypothetical protein WUBG_07804 [Wuchereria bancrofti]